jgi:hypothetical protein
MKLNFKRTNSFGDSTNKYDVNFEGELTLSQLIDIILSEKSDEWGEIYLADDWVHNKLIEYKRGKITEKVELFDEYKDKPIDWIEAHGGWSLNLNKMNKNKLAKEYVNDLVRGMDMDNEISTDDVERAFIDGMKESDKHYRWHDLVKDSSDTPNEQAFVLCRLKSTGVCICGYVWEDGKKAKISTESNFEFDDDSNYEITSWKYID